MLLDALQAPLQKIDLQGLLTDLALQLSDAAFGPALDRFQLKMSSFRNLIQPSGSGEITRQPLSWPPSASSSPR
jgi:hypothetical protein